MEIVKSIGIYGGTFDPIHFGHLNLAIELQEKHSLDEVWFCPAGLSPHKIGEAPISSKHRLEMLRLGLEGFPGFSILDLEIKRPTPSFTIDTIRELLADEKADPQNRQFYLLIGEDSINGFHRWHSAPEIIQLVPLLVASRTINEKPMAGVASPKVLAALQKGMTVTRRMDISSTDVRQRLSHGKCCKHLVPQKVLDYIERYQLYLQTAI